MATTEARTLDLNAYTLPRQLAELSKDELNELRLHVDRAVAEREERALARATLADTEEN